MSLFPVSVAPHLHPSNPSSFLTCHVQFPTGWLSVPDVNILLCPSGKHWGTLRTHSSAISSMDTRLISNLNLPPLLPVLLHCAGVWVKGGLLNSRPPPPTSWNTVPSLESGMGTFWSLISKSVQGEQLVQALSECLVKQEPCEWVKSITHVSCSILD